jgi:hypothetical protein
LSNVCKKAHVHPLHKLFKWRKFSESGRPADKYAEKLITGCGLEVFLLAGEKIFEIKFRREIYGQRKLGRTPVFLEKAKILLRSSLEG